jgi:hypothetical protein
MFVDKIPWKALPDLVRELKGSSSIVLIAMRGDGRAINYWWVQSWLSESSSISFRFSEQQMPMSRHYDMRDQRRRFTGGR